MAFKDLKPGYYKAKAVAGEFGKIGDKGTQAVAVLFQITDMPDTTITWTGWLTEKATERTMDTLVGTLGFDIVKDLMPNAAGELAKFDKSYLADREVSLNLGFEEYEGKQTLRVQWVNESKFGGGMQAKAGDAPTTDFLRQQIAAAKARLGAAAKTAAPEQPAATKTPF